MVDVSAISAVTSVKSPTDAIGLDGLGSKIAETLKSHENYIRGDIAEAIAPDSKMMTLPDHLKDQFRKWEEQYTDPEQIKMVQALKTRITDMHNDTTDYIRNKVESNSNKMRLEFAMKAISKTSSGIQQLLSAQ